MLIIAPHPDDDVLGCGGVIGKYAGKTHQVFILVITRGTPKLYDANKIENVRNEALEAHSVLGVKETVFLDYHAPELDTYPLADIARDISSVIRKFSISDLYLPHHGDIHNDHTIVFKAGLVASRPVGNYSVKNIYCYETLSETEWAAPFGDKVFIPTHFVDINDSFEMKLSAMRCFKSQLKDFPNPRSLETLEALAKYRGSTVGITRAESFMVIRQLA